MSNELLYRTRQKRLSIALGLSCFLNISLLAFGIYEWQEAGFSFLATSSFKPQTSKLYRENGKDLPTLTQSLRELELLDFDALVLALVDVDSVACGYKKQDLAISVLALRHHVDVERALGSMVPVRRLFTYMSQDQALTPIVLYPDLTADQIRSICEFTRTEKWPYTLEGLLITYKETPDPLLKETIIHTNAYRTVHILLSRSTQVSPDAIFDFVLHVDYKHIKNLHNQMVKVQDFSAEVRRGFLLDTMPESGFILYMTDPRFCLQSLSDKEALKLLQALEKHPEAAKSYALDLLEAPRSKAVWNQAIVMLSTQMQLDPQIENRKSLLERAGRKEAEKPVQPVQKAASKPEPTAQPKPQPKPQLKLQPKPQIKEILYVVQQGDTLWHISKRFGVEIDQIKKHNKLTSDALKPGSTLRIPQK